MISIPESELQFDYIRAAGPGGQNVNKVATAVQLRFDVAGSASITAEVKVRLIRLAGKRMTSEGVLVIEARRYRTQEQNRADAVARLAALIEKASQAPAIRKATKPSFAARESRLKEKKNRGQIKRTRSSSIDED